MINIIRITGLVALSHGSVESWKVKAGLSAGGACAPPALPTIPVVESIFDGSGTKESVNAVRLLSRLGIEGTGLKCYAKEWAAAIEWARRFGLEKPTHEIQTAHRYLTDARHAEFPYVVHRGLGEWAAFLEHGRSVTVGEGMELDT